MEIFNYLVFVILPIFGLGLQAALLPVLFFLKSRGWLQNYAFAIAGAIVGIGFGYGFANLGSALDYAALVIASVSLFGAFCGLGWWYLLVKRLDANVDSS